MITIAGRDVKIGDSLYHQSLKSWCRAVKYDPSGSLEVTVKTGGHERRLMVTKGGKVNGVRQMYWHEPLHLDLPRYDVSAYQKLIDLASKGGF